MDITIDELLQATIDEGGSDLHIRAYMPPYLRVHGDLVLFHTGRAGRHTVRLPDGVRGATELFGGTAYAGTSLVFETEGPETFLFRMDML